MRDEESEEINEEFENHLFEEGVIDENILTGGHINAKIHERDAQADLENLEVMHERPSTILLETELVTERTYEYVAGGMQDEMAEAYEERKKYSLKKFLKAFNKTQGVQFKTFGKYIVPNKKTFTPAEIAALS